MSLVWHTAFGGKPYIFWKISAPLVLTASHKEIRQISSNLYVLDPNKILTELGMTSKKQKPG
jgi:hypothetical protein